MVGDQRFKPKVVTKKKKIKKKKDKYQDLAKEQNFKRKFRILSHSHNCWVILFDEKIRRTIRNAKKNCKYPDIIFLFNRQEHYSKCSRADSCSHIILIENH